MILLAQTRVLVACNAEAFFTYVSNMEHYGNWFPGVEEIISCNHLPHGEVGKQYRESIILSGVGSHLTIEVKQSEFAKYFYTEGDLLPLMPAMQMTFEAEGDGACHFELSYFSRNQNLDHLIVKSIKEDLSNKIVVAIENLRKILCASDP